MPSMLLISFVEWSGAFQRPQHMALGFARRGWDVVYLCPGYLHRGRQQVDSGLDLPESLRVLKPVALPGARFWNAIGKLNEASMIRMIRRASSEPWDAIVFNDCRWAAAAARTPARTKIWDLMDDLSAHAPSSAWLREREQEALKVADHVWTGTASLAERFDASHSHVRFIACGVEGQRFSEPDPEQINRARGELDSVFDASGNAPLAGYFGALNERVKMELVEAVAKEGWRVVLIGPKSSQLEGRLDADFAKAAAAAESGSVRWIGPKPYASLPAYLALMDLALIPYDTEGPHRFLYPVKALEYLAGATPVLTTPLPDVVRFLGDFVLVAETAAEWRDVARRWPSLREEARERATGGQAHALTRTWETMIDEMSEDLLRGSQPPALTHQPKPPESSSLIAES